MQDPNTNEQASKEKNISLASIQIKFNRWTKPVNHIVRNSSSFNSDLGSCCSPVKFKFKFKFRFKFHERILCLKKQFHRQEGDVLIRIAKKGDEDSEAGAQTHLCQIWAGTNYYYYYYYNYNDKKKASKDPTKCCP